MGWAKYNEDNVSIFNNNNPDGLQRNKRQEKPLAETKPETKRQADRPLPEQVRKDVAAVNEFVIAEARPLPVIILADVSGSMGQNDKIKVLNDAVREMIAVFSEEENGIAEIHVCVIAFGGSEAKVHETLKPARKIVWKPMQANGKTPMGSAFTMAKQLVEDRNIIPGRAYRPTIVLVSDGAANDSWEEPLKELLSSERASKASRFAIGIGDDAEKTTLNAFLADSAGRVIEAHEARDIKKFFRWVTMSVTSRSRSSTPNRLEESIIDFDEIPF